MKKILVIGGTGYIGSHTIVELLENDREVVAVDDLSDTVDAGGTKFDDLRAPYYTFDSPDHEEYDPIPYATSQVLIQAYTY